MNTAKPEPKLTIKYAGVEHELIMSYGLLNRVLAVVSSQAAVEAIAFSQEMRNGTLFELLFLRPNGRGVIKNLKPEDLDDIDIELEEVQKMIGWVTDHVTDFFIGVAEQTTAVVSKYGERAQALAPSKTGTPA